MKSLVILLFLKAFIMVGIIFYAGIDLGPEEAQYWTWSQNLSWGYYSKPPGIAWEIFSTTTFFSNTELGVRFGPIILAFLSSLAVYFLALACGLKKNTAFFSALIMAISPLGVLGSFLATTDGGLILFWTLACIPTVAALREKKEPNWIYLTLAIIAGALFKWPIYILWIFIIPFFYRSSKLYLSILISFLGMFPTVIWNWDHDWVTFRHVFSTIVGTHHTSSAASHGNIIEFIGMQAGLLSPLLFLFLLISITSLARRPKTPLLFCALTTFVLLITYTVFAYFQKIQGNWCIFAYPTGIVFLSWYLLEYLSWGRVLLYLGLFIALVQNIILFSIPTLQAKDLYPIRYKYNFFRHNMGWQNLQELIKEIGYDPQKDFLFSDKYQMSSILSFYGPTQKRAYLLNMQQSRKNQFSFWPSMKEEQMGKTGYFVLAENNPYLKKWNDKTIQRYQEQLKEFFEHVEFLGIEPLFFANDKVQKSALFFKCVNYNGKEPDKTDLF